MRTIALAAGLALFSAAASAAEPAQIDWAELIPPQQKQRTVMRGVVQHDQIPDNFGNRPIGKYDPPKAEAPIREDLDGREVKMLGYVVPLRFEGTKLKEFLLAPYQGACIHVPPPPANQIVFIDSKAGIDENAFFYPVRVTGTIRVTPMSTDLADVGYSMQDPTVEVLRN
jgi:uncharacterized protein